MGSQQGSQAIRGSSAEPVGVSQTGSIETNDYDHGSEFDVEGTGAYPHTINPAETIDELLIMTSGTKIVASITTTGGDVIDLPLVGGEGSIDSYNIDEVTLKDPDGTGDRTAGGWAGE